MTPDEYFQKAFYVEFYTEPYMVLLFKDKSLYKEAYEIFKNEFRSKELFLNIVILSDTKVSLTVTSGDDFVLQSSELDYTKNRLDDFIERINTEEKISFFTDHAAINEGLIFPLEKWAAEQQEDRLVFTGYNVI